MGIDVWQGVLPENNIAALQQKLQGKMVLMGGIGALVDSPDTDEKKIREKTRRVCETFGPGGGFIPCLTYGTPGSLYPGVYETISDEIDRYNRER